MMISTTMMNIIPSSAAQHNRRRNTMMVAASPSSLKMSNTLMLCSCVLAAVTMAAILPKDVSASSLSCSPVPPVSYSRSEVQWFARYDYYTIGPSINGWSPNALLTIQTFPGVYYKAYIEESNSANAFGYDPNTGILTVELLSTPATSLTLVGFTFGWGYAGLPYDYTSRTQITECSSGMAPTPSPTPSPTICDHLRFDVADQNVYLDGGYYRGTISSSPQIPVPWASFPGATFQLRLHGISHLGSVSVPMYLAHVLAVTWFDGSTGVVSLRIIEGGYISGTSTTIQLHVSHVYPGPSGIWDPVISATC